MAGSVYKTADGWRGSIVVGRRPDGTMDRRYRRGRTKRAVQAALDQLAAELADTGGVLTRTERAATVADWLTHWLDQVAAHEVRPRTLTGYRSYVRTWLIPRLGWISLADLTAEQIETLLHAPMRAAGRSETTVLQAHRILSRALTIAERRGRIPRNPARLLSAPTPRPEEIAPLEDAETQAILAQCETDPHGVRWLIGLLLGPRQGEVLGLAWDRVDLDDGTLRITRSIGRVPGRGLLVGPPKSRAGRRSIVLPRPLLEMLRAHREAQRVAREQAGPRWKGARLHDYEGRPVTLDLVFAHPETGAAIDGRADWGRWKALCVRAGVRVTTHVRTLPDGTTVEEPWSPVRLHDLRHTAATALLRQGETLRAVMDVLGHSQVAVTLRYQHLLAGDGARIADRTRARVWGDLDERRNAKSAEQARATAAERKRRKLARAKAAASA